MSNLTAAERKQLRGKEYNSPMSPIAKSATKKPMVPVPAPPTVTAPKPQVVLATPANKIPAPKLGKIVGK